jgi:hypothetical protein
MEIVMQEGQLSASLPEYNPNKLLDAMLEKLELKNDAALSRALEIAPLSTISAAMWAVMLRVGDVSSRVMAITCPYPGKIIAAK